MAGFDFFALMRGCQPDWKSWESFLPSFLDHYDGQSRSLEVVKKQIFERIRLSTTTFETHYGTPTFFNHWDDNLGGLVKPSGMTENFFYL